MQPPKLPGKIILWICRHSLADEILGDLIEEFQHNITKKGHFYAGVIYWMSALRFINQRTLKRNNKLNNNAMLKNYIIIAVRNIIRLKTYSIINIGGLAIGIACSILLGLYIENELSYDEFNDKADKIVKTNIEYDIGDGTIEKLSLTPTALLPTMQDLFPEVVNGVRLFFPAIFKPVIVSYKTKAFQEKGVCYADSSFFEIFSFYLLEGDKSTALNEPYNIVLTRKSSKRYFGEKRAYGQTIIVNGKPFKVTGIMEDVPPNSSIQFDFIASFSSYWKRAPVWSSANYLTFVELNKPMDTDELSSKIQSELIRIGVSDPDNGAYVGVGFTPLLDMHLHSDLEQSGNIKNLYVFGVITLLILLVAIINYSNLATAKSFYRTKEVGLRKSMGAHKQSIFFQLLGESFVTTFLAFLLAFILAYFLLPLFALVSGSSIQLDVLLKPTIVIVLVLSFLIISLLSGVYPATKMAAYRPANILRGKYQGTKEGLVLRKSLIVIQFFISSSLIIATVIMFKQLNYISNKHLGYNKDNLLVMPVSKAIMKKADEFKNIALRDDNVYSASIVGETPPNIQGGYGISLSNNKSMGVTAVAVDDSFIETTKMTLVAGRPISLEDIKRTREAKEYSFIVNEDAARKLGWAPTEAIGQKIKLNGREGEIRGVVKDFNFRTLYEEVSPLVLFSEQTWAYNYIMVRINANNIPAAIEAIEKSWKQIDDATPISYNFLDQEFADLYVDSNRSGRLLTSFATLAILIACLGLFGIVSFSMTQRKKEIGLRKVLGASTANLLIVTNKEFLQLIIIAFIPAFPATIWIMNKWLSSFAYHIEIGIWPIILGFSLTMVIAVCTISFEGLKVAFSNPVDALRME